MRPFPGASPLPARLTLTAALTASALTLVTVASSPAASTVNTASVASGRPASTTAPEDDLRDQRRDIREKAREAKLATQEASRRVTALTSALRASRQSLATAQANLVSVRQRLDAARMADQEARANLTRAEDKLVVAETDLLVSQAAVETQRQFVKDLVISLYQQGDPTLVALTGYLGAQEPSDLLRQQEYAAIASTKHLDIFDDLSDTERALRQQQTTFQAARDEVAARRDQAAHAVATAQDLATLAVTQKRDVRARIVSTKSAEKAARRAQTRDLNKLKRLERQDARLTAKILAAVKAAQAAAAAKGDHGFTGAAGGYLDYPVTGRVSSPFGYRIHPIYKYWGLHDGIDFAAPCGGALRAPADGTVVSKYYSSVYGNRLFVNLGPVNGEDLIAIYNHSESYNVSQGDRVERGQVIGAVGSSGWSTGCHLHFTVMENGTAVDPQKYL